MATNNIIKGKDWSDDQYEKAVACLKAAGAFGYPRNYKDFTQSSDTFNDMKESFGIKINDAVWNQEDYTDEQTRIIEDLKRSYAERFGIELLNGELSPKSRPHKRYAVG